jgi:hypothetical protein
MPHVRVTSRYKQLGIPLRRIADADIYSCPKGGSPIFGITGGFNTPTGAVLSK